MDEFALYSRALEAKEVELLKSKPALLTATKKP